jgi:lysophospholipase L1-like esterase
MEAHMTTARALLVSLPAICALSAPGPVRAASMTYLALGDSVAFGETDFSRNPSFGDRGYVGPYASFLADRSGGVRPNVVNLAIDGETSSTFFNGGARVYIPQHGESPVQLNLNYSSPATTQNAQFLATIAAQKSAGNTINTVSVQLGANDLFAVMNSPGFFALPPQQQQAQILQALAGFQTNETKLLTEVRTQLPGAALILPGYYNPYAVDPSSPLATLAGQAIQGLNAIIAGEALAFGGRYVDVYPTFAGHEAAYTFILQGNVHPNDIGYGAIAARIEAVPEPATWSVLAAGLVGLGLARRRRAGAL